MKEIRVPQRIDEMPHLMIWRMDVFLIGISGLIGMVALGSWIMLPISLIAAWQYSKTQQGRPEGYLGHLLYSKGIYGAGFNSFLLGWPTPKEAGRSFMTPFIKRLYP